MEAFWPLLWSFLARVAPYFRGVCIIRSISEQIDPTLSRRSKSKPRFRSTAMPWASCVVRQVFVALNFVAAFGRCLLGKAITPFVSPSVLHVQTPPPLPSHVATATPSHQSSIIVALLRRRWWRNNNKGPSWKTATSRFAPTPPTLSGPSATPAELTATSWRPCWAAPFGGSVPASRDPSWLTPRR